MKKLLFVDRDGTLIREPEDYQVDSFEKLEFLPGVFSALRKLREDFDLIMITNQDGLGTESFPEDTFWPVQNFIVKAFENEGVVFRDILIDRTFEKDEAPTRKPRTGLVDRLISESDIDVENSWMVGDRSTDIEFAKNVGCKSVFIKNDDFESEFEPTLIVETWDEITKGLSTPDRTARIVRKTTRPIFVCVSISMAMVRTKSLPVSDSSITCSNSSRSIPESI